jgi:hypothetical protein
MVFIEKPTQRNMNEEVYFSDSDLGNESEMEYDFQESLKESAELPPEYWQIQKLIKYLKIGNQTTTIIAICSLKDFDLKNRN